LLRYQAQNNEQNVPINSNQRFSPLLAANETIPSSSSLALQPLVNRINNTQPFDQNLAGNSNSRRVLSSGRAASSRAG
jgi:hypothetical protein